jgi:ribonuclease HII
MSEKLDLFEFDRRLAAGLAGPVIGIDEAGRGCLAGPVIAAAVLLDEDTRIDGVNDSKKLSPKKREELFDAIMAKARGVGIGAGSIEEIESRNILRATLMAMRRAIEQIDAAWDVALVDGNRSIEPFFPGKRQLTVIDGDAQSASIAAASIIAKVTRDRLMRTLSNEFPAYGFETHKGYGTALHMERIRRHGLSPVHRKSFCANLVAQTELMLSPADTAIH